MRRAAADDGASTLLSRPTEYTDVADAFDGQGVDVRLSLGYTFNSGTAQVLRERQAASGIAERVTLGNFESTQKHMWMVAEVGLYRDLMAFVRVPFLLQERRGLLALTDAAREATFLGAADKETTSLVSPVRYGVPRVHIGAAYGPLNQFRDPGWPTVVLRLEAHWPVGGAIKPCVNDAGCSRSANRGTWGMLAETRFSYRYRYLEPYAGFALGQEFVTGSGQGNYYPAGLLAADLDRDPPTHLGWTAGLAVIPWEARHRFQRLTVDTRLSALWVSRGRDYSPLYDALGSSGDPRLGTTEAGFFGGGADIVSPFTGMTTVDSHARLSGELSLRIQAARYVRFQLAVGVSLATAHAITGTDPCSNGGLAVQGEQVSCASGTENPSFRSVLDQPGQRFFVRNILGLGATLAAAAHF